MRIGGRLAKRRLWFALVAVAAGVVIAVVALVVATDVDERVSLPWRPSPAAKYPAAAECAACHPTQAAAWQGSPHARAARNPLAHAPICGRCHTPLGTQLGPEYQMKLYDGSEMPAVPASAAEGITCVVCHAAVHAPEAQLLTFEPVWPNWRTTDLALEILPFEAARGTFGLGTADDPTPVQNDGHPSLADASLSSAELCWPCHDVLVDKSPLAPHLGLGQAKVRLLTTFEEWSASPYAKNGQTCQSCHMPREVADGPAAVAPPGTTYERDLPARPLASHAMTGISTEYPATGPDVDRQEAQVAELLQGAASVALQVPPSVAPGDALDLAATVTNTGAGHNLPTGFDFWSEAWLEVTVTDAGGRVLFASGDVDENGWLRDEFNPRVRSGQLDYDAYLLSLRARLVTVGPNRAKWLQPDGTLAIPMADIDRNLNGTPILGTADFAVDGIMRQLYPDMPPAGAASPFQEGYILRFADTVVRTGIPARQSRQARYWAPLDPPVRGPVRVTARLLMRSLWPWMLQQQDELPTPRPQPRVYTVATDEAVVAVGPP